MIRNKILHADIKGRILLGKEYSGALLGVNVHAEGLLLRRMEVVPMKVEKKIKSSKDIFKFAGSWEKMSTKDLNQFLKEVKSRRKLVSKREKI